MKRKMQQVVLVGGPANGNKITVFAEEPNVLVNRNGRWHKYTRKNIKAHGTLSGKARYVGPEDWPYRPREGEDSP